MTDKSLEVIVGEAQSPVHDLTDYVDWDRSRFMSTAYNGQSSVSSIVFRDELSEMGPWTDTDFTLAARNEVEVKLGSVFIWRGRLIGRSWQRGIQKADTAREVTAEAEDVNSELNLINVDQWPRPEETDVERVTALGADYLAGSVRVGTNLDVATLVPNTNTVTLAAKTYTQTTPMGVLQDIITQSHKVYWVTLNKELFYDMWDSSAYDSGLRITEDIDELAADPDGNLMIVPDAGPLFAINGQRFVSALRVYYGSGPTDYVDVDDPSMEAVKAHAAEVVYAPDTITTAEEATRMAEGLLAERSQDGRTFNLSVRAGDGGSLTEAQVALLQHGRRITIKSHVLPLASYSDYPTRIVSVQWHMPLPGQFYATLKLEKPEKAYGLGRKRGLELCYDETFANSCTDTFTRFGLTDWGRSEIACLDWVSSDYGTHTVDGERGKQTLTADDTVVMDWLPMTDMWDGTTVDFIAKVAGSNEHTPKQFNAYQSDGTVAAYGPVDNPATIRTFVWSYSLDPDGDVSTSVLAHRGAVQIDEGFTASGVNADDGAEFWVRCQLTATGIRMKAWADGDPEPGTWNSEATDAGGDFVNGIGDCDVFSASLGALVAGVPASFAGEWQSVSSIAFSSGINCGTGTCIRKCTTGGPDATSGTSIEGAAADHDHDSVDNGDPAGGDLSGTYPNPSVVDDSHNHTAATVPAGAGPWEEVSASTWKLITGVSALQDQDSEAFIEFIAGWISLRAFTDGGILLEPNNSTAGGDDFAKVYIDGGHGLVLNPLAADPTGAAAEDGQLYYNTTDEVIRQHIAGAWQDVGSGGGSLSFTSIAKWGNE